MPSLDPSVLLDTSALAIRDFMHIRKSYFEFAAWELRASVEQGAYSIQEKVMGVLLGSINLPTGEQILTPSIYELLDFFELGTTSAGYRGCFPGKERSMFIEDMQMRIPLICRATWT